MTGFRVASGGAQALYDVTPDLTTLGKVIGGGLPVGAYGGRREIMELVAPAGPCTRRARCRQPAGDGRRDRDAARRSLSPACGSGSCARASGYWRASSRRCPRPESRRKRRPSARCAGCFFAETPIRSWEDAKLADAKRFAAFHRAMLERGVYLAPSQFEACVPLDRAWRRRDRCDDRCRCGDIRVDEHLRPGSG